MDFKRITIILYGFIGLLIISLSIFLGFEYLLDSNQWLGLIVGIVFMVLGGVCFFNSEKITALYMVTFVLNMIGVGLSITAYYVFKSYPLEFVDFFTAIFISMGVLSVFGLLTRLSFVKKHLKLVISLTIFISFTLSLILWLSVDGFTGLSFYFLNVIYFFMIAMIQTSNSINDLSKEMAIVSFGSFLLVSIIVLIIISEGEILEGLGDGVSGMVTPSKKKSKK